MTTAALPRTAPVRPAYGRLVAGVAAAVAGVVHLLVGPAHMEGPLVVPMFFLLVGMAQLFAAAVLVAHTLRPAGVVGLITAHVALIGLYVASRSIDLPFVTPHVEGHGAGPEAAPGAVGNGTPVYPGARVEPVGALDLVCVGAELVLVVALLAGLPARWRRGTLDALVLLGVGAVLLRLAM